MNGVACCCWECVSRSEEAARREQQRKRTMESKTIRQQPQDRRRSRGYARIVYTNIRSNSEKECFWTRNGVRPQLMVPSLFIRPVLGFFCLGFCSSFILPFGWGMIAIAATVMNAVDRRSVMSCCWSFILCCVFHLRNSGVRYEGFKDGHTREPIYRGHRTKVSYPPDVFVFGFAHSLLASFACTRT